MSYRYKQAEVRNRNLLDAEQVRDGLVEQLGSLQALDRDQLPHGAVDEDMIADGAMHQMLSADVNSENETPYRATSAASQRDATYNFLPNYVFPPGVLFQNYQGGSVVLCQEDIVCRGGVIQAEFSCWTWRETWPDYNNEGEVPHRYYLTLSINGRAVASTGAVAQHWSNIHLVGSGVAPEGTAQVRVEWAITGIDTAGLGGQANMPQFAVGGTSLLIQNRRT